MALLLVVGVIGREEPRAVVLVLLQLKGESEQVTETVPKQAQIRNINKRSGNMQFSILCICYQLSESV